MYIQDRPKFFPESVAVKLITKTKANQNKKLFQRTFYF